MIDDPSGIRRDLALPRHRMTAPSPTHRPLDSSDRWRWLARHDPSGRARALESMAALFLLPAISWSLFIRDDRIPFASLTAGLVVLVLTWFVSVLLHEGGHALAARLAGLRPYLLQLGAGPRLLRRRIGGIVLDVGLLPGSGLTLLAGRRKPHMRWRLLAAYAGGPAVNVLLVLAGVGLASSPAMPSGSEPSPAVALVVVNGLLLALSIIPLPGRSAPATPRNDFLQMVTLPWLDAKRIQALDHAADAAEIFQLLQLRDYEAAYRRAHRELDRNPDNWVVRSALAEMLLFARLYSEASEQYRVLLEDGIPEGALPPDAHALITSNYAWSLYMLDDPSLLEAADRCSAQARDALPGNPSVLGARGAILIERGSVLEGSALVRRAFQLHRDPAARASNLSCLVIAAARAGQTRQAKRLLRQSRRLDPDCALIARAGKAVQGRTA